MEKKTIGKFISALRRANGMTQKELAEKLFVSDKTVSRWERDECTPELSLIPVIAEIFHITTDELLRGEKKSDEKAGNIENEGGRYSTKGEKQFMAMLYNHLRRYGNLTLISVGLALAGWIIAVICNFAFYNGVLGFGLATVFILASVICQICFVRNAPLPIEAQEEVYHVRVQETNAKITRSAIRVFLLDLALVAFTLPIAFSSGVSGLALEVWMGNGLLFMAIALVLAYVVYTLWIIPILVKERLLFPYLPEEDEKRKRRAKRIRVISIVVGCVAILIAFSIWMVNFIGGRAFAEYKTFDDPYAFKEYMEAEYDRWFENEHNGSIIINPDPDVEDYYEYMDQGYIYGEDGETVEYYYAEELYEEIDYLGEDRKAPVRVLTKSAYHTGYSNFNDLLSCLYWLFPLDIIGGVIVYSVLLLRDRKNNG